MFVYELMAPPSPEDEGEDEGAASEVPSRSLVRGVAWGLEGAPQAGALD